MIPKPMNMPAYLKALSVMAFIIVLILFLIVGKSLLVPLFMGGFFAILFTPFSMFLEKYKVPRTVSSVISLLLMIAIVVGLISFIIGNVVSFTKDFNNVSARLVSVAEGIDTWTTDNLGFSENLAEKAKSDSIAKMLTENSFSISAFALKAIGSLSGLVLIPVFMFFFLLYRDHLTKMMVKIYQDKDPALVKMRITNLRKVIQNYITGVGKVMVILAILNITAYSVLGIKHAIFFGIIGAVLNIIPYIGPFVGALLPAVYSFLTMDSLFVPIAALAIYQVIQMIESNFLTPKIVGGNVNLNAFITFLGLLVGAAIWGVAGMILVIPAMAILREIFDLSENTKPFAMLLGEEKKDEKPKSKNENTE
ncbi:Predicted PurR-regulated permease PerM [Algoriphagus alkaliphilus]|uniref:Predicted PurR-regulated permease PerM n=1 Tax=Algoriphagus alkaliphilus TaxID=279824 RepID=A0A1G5X5H5_9BACT|nr:AI-2E family transporter [Algoriphagus alkaliphilus]SDA65663.1 Predicted PurR-regulated permease PerM [Algoriphagus alkaliphilus]